MIGKGATGVGKAVERRLDDSDDIACALRFEIARLRERVRAIQPHLQRRGDGETARDQDQADNDCGSDPERRLARNAGKRMTQESRTCETRHRRAIPLK